MGRRSDVGGKDRRFDRGGLVGIPVMKRSSCVVVRRMGLNAEEGWVWGITLRLKLIYCFVI